MGYNINYSINNYISNSIRNYNIYNYIRKDIRNYNIYKSIRKSIRKGIYYSIEYIYVFSLNIPA
jgi:hypothetical protein